MSTRFLIVWKVEKADIWAENLEYTPSGLKFDAVTREIRVPIISHLIWGI